MTTLGHPPALPAALAPVVRTLTQEKIQRYGQASGDLNPLHMDTQAAVGSRFGGTIAHGMLLLAYISETMTAAFGLDWLRSGRLRVRFRSVARPGDVVTAGGRLKALREEGGGRQATYDVEARNQRDEVLISGEAEVEVPGEGR